MTIAQNGAKRPPLSTRQRVGAFVAGAVGFLLIAAGLDGLAVVLLWVALLLFAILLVGGFADAFGATDGLARSVLGPLAEGLWPLAIVFLVVIGVVIVAGFLVSTIVLRRTGNVRAGAITWSAFALAMVAQVTVGLVVVSIVSSIEMENATEQTLIVAVLFLPTVALGGLIWWWMAWAFRPGPIAATYPVGADPLVAEPVAPVEPSVPASPVPAAVEPVVAPIEPVPPVQQVPPPHEGPGIRI